MRSALIIPSEFCTTSLEVKRALLTYDQVKIIDPAERDIMPPQAQIAAIIGIPIIGMNMGPINEIGKVANYDNDFDKLVEEVLPAINQNIVQVIRTYPESNAMTIGGIDLGSYPLHPIV